MDSRVIIRSSAEENPTGTMAGPPTRKPIAATRWLPPDFCQCL